MNSKSYDKSRNKDGVITEEEYIAAKRKLSNSQQKFRKRSIICFIGCLSVIMFFSYTFTATKESKLSDDMRVIISITAGIIVGVAFGYMYNFLLSIFDYRLYSKVNEYEIRHLHEEVQNDIFENSIKMSYKYLDQYYLQIRDQAQKGFFVTVCVSVFGAILIGVGIVLMFMDITNPSYITCASGVITEFIATIFFYMYNKTVTSMSKYHNKLVLSHNISIALKVADTLPEEDKVKSKNLIISELLKDMNSHLIRSDSEDTKK